eukprot:6481498-Pyramimonas_sp.AAC.1
MVAQSGTIGPELAHRRTQRMVAYGPLRSTIFKIRTAEGHHEGQARGRPVHLQATLQWPCLDRAQ